jgi:hypothetical protein
MHSELTFTRALVRKAMLETPVSAWTVQGFGFLRTYFGPPENPKSFRLNLWDSKFTVPNVSTIHDHPWDFSSLIVAGMFINQRYTVSDPETYIAREATHHFTTIKTGTGGGLEKSPVEYCTLVPISHERYDVGDTYSQRAAEIHETVFKDGSVTLNERVGDTQHARVFWPVGTDWVDAMPRQATDEEVSGAVFRSLRDWF